MLSVLHAVGGTAVIRCICEADRDTHMHTHARELRGETAAAGSGQLTDKGYAAQPAAPLRPHLSRYVQPKCRGL